MESIFKVAEWFVKHHQEEGKSYCVTTQGALI